MMDQSALDSTTSRHPSTPRDRPTRAPSGPRIRTRQKSSLDITSHGSSSPLPCTPTFTNPFSRPNSPAFDATANSLDNSFSTSAPQPAFSVASYPPSTAEVAVQVPSSPCPSSSPPTASQQKSPTLVSKPSVATFLPPSPLPPSPEISFEPTPIPWKGLPFEAAQWTFSSAELQDIVSKAIRLSAKESFVRLLSLQALETDIANESERLETERLTAQAKWKFEVGRRSMLMQALNSSAAVLSGAGDGDKNSGLSLLITQLATAIGSCDSQLASILHISDQQSQIAIIQHRHWASALSVALRKLNKSYERQGEELRRALEKVQTLEDELEDAWKEAKVIAEEMDDIDNEKVESESEDDSDDPPSEKNVCDDTGNLEDLTMNTEIGEVVGVTAFAVASKATLLAPEVTPKTDKSDAKSVKSVKSSRSKRSARDGPSRVSRVSAARVRSRAMSNASLRLPRALRTSSAIPAPPIDVPPIPALPDTSQGHSFLDMGDVGNEYIRHPKRSLPMRHPEPKAALPEPPHTAGLPRTNIPSIWMAADADQSTGRSNTGIDRSHSMHILSSLTSHWPRRGRRSNLVMSLSNSDPGPASTSTQERRRERTSALVRPGSADARLVNNHGDTPRSLVSRAGSSLLRRLSHATFRSSKRYSSSLTYTSEEGGGGGAPMRTPNTNLGES